MNIQTEKYLEVIKQWPASGQHILSYQAEGQMVVYQAYNHQIANYAVQHQVLGGNHFSYSRMSWIKPNFLWMMFRCGWALKENQERVLALWIDTKDFENILEQAVFSSFNSTYSTQEEWKQELATKEVRLQWDPDHDPLGNKQVRRAIQLGLKGEMLEHFGKKQIRKVEDITPFVQAQKKHVDQNLLDELSVPLETIYKPSLESLCKKIGLS